MDMYETYVRTADGRTFHPETFREGIEQFLSEEGYRISFNIDGIVMTLRKDHPVDADMRTLDERTGARSVCAAVTLRGV